MKVGVDHGKIEILGGRIGGIDGGFFDGIRSDRFSGSYVWHWPRRLRLGHLRMQQRDYLHGDGQELCAESATHVE